MVIKVIDQFDVEPTKAKHQSPTRRDIHSPVAAIASVQGMQAISGQPHVSRQPGLIQLQKQTPQPSHMISTDSGNVAPLIERLQALMPEADDHAAQV
ncbi:hypothetical protein YH67_16185 [Stenotrophomonas maltophilia]|nr:hypothetical protein YH67_16185 [Stenotrophomonas maltophilia]ALA91679.1 hypothetical protein YH68_16185 [Stenotrophomonas maltophilia]